MEDNLIHVYNSHRPPTPLQLHNPIIKYCHAISLPEFIITIKLAPESITRSHMD